MSHIEHSGRHGYGIELTPQLQSSAHLMGERQSLMDLARSRSERP